MTHHLLRSCCDCSNSCDGYGTGVGRKYCIWPDDLETRAGVVVLVPEVQFLTA